MFPVGFRYSIYKSRCFILDLDIAFKDLDAGYISRLIQLNSGYFLNVSIYIFSFHVSY